MGQDGAGWGARREIILTGSAGLKFRPDAIQGQKALGVSEDPQHVGGDEALLIKADMSCN